MNQPLQTLLYSITQNQKSMVDQLHDWCEINSGTEHLAGLAQMHKTLNDAFSPLADEIHTLSFAPIKTLNMSGETILQTCGDALFIRKRPHLKRRVLLSGHMDTVYAEHHPFQALNFINDNHLNGPGVADMKGGLIVILHALLAFESTKGHEKLGWDVFINADEEIGSLASGAQLKAMASDYQAALVYEPAMTASGLLAKNRRGSGKLTLIATGKAAHVGRAFDEGRNAICFLAQIITAVHKLNGKRHGVTINVGKIAGGDALNVVPDKAVAKLDIRIEHPDDEHWVRQQLELIINKIKQPDYSLTIHGSFDRPVKRINPPTQRLFNRIQHIGRTLGLTLDWQDSGGCCDGNNLSVQGLPVLDTLGVRGGEIHSAGEFILIDSLVERASLSALLLVDLAQGGLEELTTS
jgi:glutamate carboxypeptidase